MGRSTRLHTGATSTSSVTGLERGAAIDVRLAIGDSATALRRAMGNSATTLRLAIGDSATGLRRVIGGPGTVRAGVDVPNRE